ncbi:long-chain fatty acid--CoA ligase [Kribbella antibiotica]|uniref:long-chain fatty acid--CoA ligase n=1 Tax=Kribbella antibiotica TaxID=190195 RepID=UPI001404ADF2|nr:long-chain fatty acid--CoA ligase [Kribbella antibiotica]
MNPVRPLDAADPVRAVLEARERGVPIALATSGTTDRPRFVVRDPESWWASFPAYSELTGVGPGASVWIPGPLSATMNLFAAVHAAAVGARVVEDAADATHACMTPAQLDRLGGELRPDALVCVAGARLEQRSAGPQVVHYYGAAELSFVAAGNHGDDLQPFKGVEVDLRDGEIWVRSPYVCLGYADGAAGPLRTDRDGWATVGDRGRWSGTTLSVLGRPGTVTTAGATVVIAEVEEQLAKVARGPVVVFGVPHEVLGEVLAVAVVESADLTRLKAYAREHLPSSHRPRRWQVVDELPLTAGGKVDRARLASV